MRRPISAYSSRSLRGKVSAELADEDHTTVERGSGGGGGGGVLAAGTGSLRGASWNAAA